MLIHCSRTVLMLAALISTLAGCSRKPEPVAKLEVSEIRPEPLPRSKYSKQETFYDFSTEFKLAIQEVSQPLSHYTFGSAMVDLPEEPGQLNRLLTEGEIGEESPDPFAPPQSEAELPEFNVYGSGWEDANLKELPIYELPWVIGISRNGKLPESWGDFPMNQTNIQGIRLSVMSDSLRAISVYSSHNIIFLDINVQVNQRDKPNKDDRSGEIIDLLKYYPNLRSLKISCNDLEPKTFEAIKSLRALEILKLDYCGELSRECFELICDCKQLRCLDMRGTFNSRNAIDMDTLPLAKLTKLEYLDLGGLGLSNALALKLGACTKLKAIDGFGLYPLSSDKRLQDDGLQSIARLPNLKGVRLPYLEGITDVGFRTLFHNKDLEFLFLDGIVDISAKSLSGLAEMSQLRRLSLGFDEQMKQSTHYIDLQKPDTWTGLSHLSNLRVLEFGSWFLTDAIIKPILPELMSLELFGLNTRYFSGYPQRDSNELSVAIVKLLAELPKLRKMTLHVRDFDRLTEETFLALERNSSILEITIYGGTDQTSQVTEAMLKRFRGARLQLGDQTRCVQGRIDLERFPNMD